MAMAKKGRLSTKALAAFDPYTAYGGKTVVIQGVVSPSSQCSFQGTQKGYNEHCFKLAAWRMVGGPLVTNELYIQRPIRTSGDWPGVFQQHTIHRMEVLLSEDHTRAVFARRLGMTQPDEELVQVNLRLLQPVVLATEEFGEFTLNRGLNWFEGKAIWEDHEVIITLPGPQSVLLEDDFELPELEQPVKAAYQIWRRRKTWDRKCKHCAVRDLLALKNEHWLEDGESPLRATEFAARMQLTSIAVDADGRIELWYSADGIFTDHAILIGATLEDGPTSAGIEG